MYTTASSTGNYQHYIGGNTAADCNLALSDYSYYSSLLAQAHTKQNVAAAADQQQTQLSELEQLKTESSAGLLRLADPHHPFGIHALNM